MIALLLKNHLKHWRLNIAVVLLVALGIALPVITQAIVTGKQRALERFVSERLLMADHALVFPSSEPFSGDSHYVDGLLKESFPQYYSGYAGYGFSRDDIVLYKDISDMGFSADYGIRSDIEAGTVLVSASLASQWELRDGGELYLLPAANLRTQQPLLLRISVAEDAKLPLQLKRGAYISMEDAKQLNLKIYMMFFQLFFSRKPDMAALRQLAEGIGGTAVESASPRDALDNSGLNLSSVFLHNLDENAAVALMMQRISLVFAVLAVYSTWISMQMSANIRRTEFALLRSLGLEESRFALMLLLEVAINVALSFCLAMIAVLAAGLAISSSPLYLEIFKFLGLANNRVYIVTLGACLKWLGIFLAAVTASAAFPIMAESRVGIMDLWRQS